MTRLTLESTEGAPFLLSQTCLCSVSDGNSILAGKSILELSIKLDRIGLIKVLSGMASLPRG